MSKGLAASEALVRIALAQINNGFSYQGRPTFYLPYSVGLMRAYVEKYAQNPEKYHFLPLLFRRGRIHDSVQGMLEADVVGVSFYQWNASYSLEMVRRLKAIRPNVLVILGGPQVPDRAEAFLREHRYIDIVVHKEGERTFLKIMEAYPNRDWAGIAGVSYIDDSGTFHTTEVGSRILDLDQIPSPFLNGAFDALMAAHPEISWITTWETNRGCPFQCTFCDWGSATAAKVTRFELDRLKHEIDWFGENRISYVYCADANFGILKRDVEIAEYLAKTKKSTGSPNRVFVQGTKNATERAYETQKILHEAGLSKGVTLSMQSVDAQTLSDIKRDNISLKTYMELQQRFTRDRILTYTDMIIGLPGETYESFANGVDALIDSGQHNRINFNNLAILPNAEMGHPDYQKRYGLVTITSEIVNLHGIPQISDDDVPEMQDLVIATNTMPAADWRRTRMFTWMVSLLHFDKLLQIPLVLLRKYADVGYRDAIESILAIDPAEYPILGEMRGVLDRQAIAIENGGVEFIHAPEWLGIYWYPDEYVFIKLTAEGKLDRFYEESERLLGRLLENSGSDMPAAALHDAVQLNRAILKQPGALGDVMVRMQYDVVKCYRDVLEGKAADLRKTPTVMRINRSKWCWPTLDTWAQQVVWVGNQSGDYVYPYWQLEEQLA